MSPGIVAESYPMLADLTEHQVRTAVQALLLDGREFPPLAGQIRLKVAELEEPRQLWGEVWREIQHNIHLYGGYSDPETVPWSSPYVAELVRLRDWTFLCTCTDQPSVVEAQTRGAWEALRERRLQERAYKPLQAAGFRRLLEINPQGGQSPPRK
jgi:hypothetical protein